MKTYPHIPFLPVLLAVLALAGCKSPKVPSICEPLQHQPTPVRQTRDEPHVIRYPSPNYSERKTSVSIIMLHYTAGGTVGALKTLTTPHGEQSVSAHYVVDPEGVVYQLVDESKRAWHAGPGSWNGCDDVNSASIGIEIVNLGHDDKGNRIPYPEVQIKSVIRLCKAIQSRHDIQWVIGHSDVGLGRKDDPGEHFPWKRLAHEGIGFWTDEFSVPTRSSREMLSAIGYDTSHLDRAIEAFQRHFYPEALTSGGTRTYERMAAVLKVIEGLPR